MDYFIAGDFYNKSTNRYFYGIVTADLKKTSLPEVAAKLIDENFKDVNSLDVTIKVRTFNNIEM